MTRSKLPPGRRRGFGESRAAGVLIGVGLLTMSGLLVLLGRALRAGDENLIDF